jgi:hypothetical protein
MMRMWMACAAMAVPLVVACEIGSGEPDQLDGGGDASTDDGPSSPAPDTGTTPPYEPDPEDASTSDPDPDPDPTPPDDGYDPDPGDGDGCCDERAACESAPSCTAVEICFGIEIFEGPGRCVSMCAPNQGQDFGCEWEQGGCPAGQYCVPCDNLKGCD